MSEEKEPCTHEDEYPIAAFLTPEKPWLWLYCEDCGTNRILAGETANNRED